MNETTIRALKSILDDQVSRISAYQTYLKRAEEEVEGYKAAIEDAKGTLKDIAGLLDLEITD